MIRKVTPNDIADLKVVLNSIELFPAEMLDDMIADYFNNPESEDIWLSKIQDGKAVAIGFCTPEQLTMGTFNLKAIGVLQNLQGQGIGGEMMDFLEDYLKNLGHRILIVDTSGLAAFEATRQFYVKKGYTLAATLKDFWEEGDDKVTFWKKL